LVIFTVTTNKISIKSDIWTAGKYGLSYSCVTAHYIDHDWIFQKKVLSFRTMNYPHTAQIIYQSIINVLHEYNLKRDLENKIYFFFDNASNNIKSINYFTHALNPIMDGRMFYQKYICHILSLTVKTGLKTTSVNNLICKFKDGLHHIYSNNIRK
jgi:hypothetical protein